MDQVNEYVPLVIGENREIPSLTDLDLLARKLHFRAGAAPKGTQLDFPVVQSNSPPSFHDLKSLDMLADSSRAATGGP